PRHVFTRIIDNIAHLGSPSHMGPRKYPKSAFKRPSAVRQSQRRPQLKTLNVASNIHTQARPLSTVGTINGNKTVARMKRAKRILRFSKTASHMPNTAFRTVVVKVKKTVFQTVPQKIWLSKRCVKLRRPMKWAGLPTSLSVRDSHTPRLNG